MAPLSTSRATDDDLDELVALAARTFPLACPPGTLTEDIDDFVATVLCRSAFERYVHDPDRIVRVAARDGHLVGYTMLVLTAPSDPDVSSSLTVTPAVEVSKLYADVAAHGTGVAGALMDSAVDETRAAGRRALWLGVNNENARALTFYRRNGFQQVGHKRFALGAVLHHDYVMQRVLD